MGVGAPPLLSLMLESPGIPAPPKRTSAADHGQVGTTEEDSRDLST